MAFSNYKLALKTENLKIETLGSHLNYEAYLAWFSNPDVKKNIEYGKGKTPTIEDLKGYVQTMNDSDQDLLVGLFFHDGSHIGNMKFGPIDLKTQTAIMGVLIGDPSARGRGVFQEAFLALSQRLFEQFKVYRFRLGVAADNRSALRAYEKTGFKVVSEGKTDDLRQYFSMEYKISG